MNDPLQLPPDVSDQPQQIKGRRPRRSAWRFAWIWVFVIAIPVMYPIVFKQRDQGMYRTEALNKVRQIGLCLFEFEAEYGQFPDKATAAKVKEATGTPLTLGDGSSNQLFRQLLAFGARGEDLFWTWTPDSDRRPDQVFTSDATALEPGECSFAYIAGLSSSSPSGTPVLMAPMIPGTTTFDRKFFKGMAIVLFLGNSAQPLPIDKSGHVVINGMDLLDPSQPFWKGKAPDIKWPE